MNLVTSRCILRAPTADDAGSIARYANNRNVWLNVRDLFPHPYRIEDANAWIEKKSGEDPRLNFTIDVEGEAVGGIGLVPGRDIERISAEIGYWLGEPFWGRGIMTEAVGAICDYGFAQLPLSRIFAAVMEYNTASFRVLEKAGFEREAVLRKACTKDGRILDTILYARIAP